MRKFIEPGDPSHPVQFGFSVALNGSTALAGAPGAEVDGNPYQGTAYFYEQDDFGFTVAAPQTVQPGADFVSQTIATNNSSAASPAVSVTMSVPAAASFVSATPTQGSCSEASGIVACDFGPISGNAGRATANVTLKVIGGLGTTIENTASLTNAKPELEASAKSVVANDSPPIAKDGTLTTEENIPASGTLEASDPDGDQFTFIMVDPPSHGTVTLSDASTGAYLYTPDKNYLGTDSFTFKANDGQADSNVATISITVTAAPPPPPPPSGGGGGATGPFGLCLLGFVGLLAVLRRRR